MKSKRNQAIEALRIVSALGIVWYHANIWGSSVAYAGLVAFLVIGPIFEAGRERSELRPISTIARRLLVPWAVWMSIYAVFNLVRGEPAVPLDNGVLAGILIGSGQHLWFLPFLFAVLAILSVARRVISRDHLWISCSVLLLAMIATYWWWRPWSVGVGYPVAQYMHALPAALVGVAFGAMGFPGRNFAQGGLIIAGIATLLFQPAGGGIAYLIGVVAVVIALAPRVVLGASHLDLSRIAPAMFGVYLIHLLALWPMWPLIRQGFEVPAVLVAFALSVCTVLMTRKISPKVSALVFGY